MYIVESRSQLSLGNDRAPFKAHQFVGASSLITAHGNEDGKHLKEECDTEHEP